MTHKIKFFIPSIITTLGALLAIMGLNLWPLFIAKILLIASLFCDCIDGFIARKLEATTEFGAIFDFNLDAILAIAISWCCFTKPISLMLTILLIVWQVYCRYKDIKFSGRTAITILAVLS